MARYRITFDVETHHGQLLHPEVEATIDLDLHDDDPDPGLRGHWDYSHTVKIEMVDEEGVHGPKEVARG